MQQIQVVLYFALSACMVSCQNVTHSNTIASNLANATDNQPAMTTVTKNATQTPSTVSVLQTTMNVNGQITSGSANQTNNVTVSTQLIAGTTAGTGLSTLAPTAGNGPIMTANATSGMSSNTVRHFSVNVTSPAPMTVDSPTTTTTGSPVPSVSMNFVLNQTSGLTKTSTSMSSESTSVKSGNVTSTLTTWISTTVSSTIQPPTTMPPTTTTVTDVTSETVEIVLKGMTAAKFTTEKRQEFKYAVTKSINFYCKAATQDKCQTTRVKPNDVTIKDAKQQGDGVRVIFYVKYNDPNDNENKSALDKKQLADLVKDDTFISTLKAAQFQVAPVSKKNQPKTETVNENLEPWVIALLAAASFLFIMFIILIVQQWRKGNTDEDTSLGRIENGKSDYHRSNDKVRYDDLPSRISATPNNQYSMTTFKSDQEEALVNGRGKTNTKVENAYDNPAVSVDDVRASTSSDTKPDIEQSKSGHEYAVPNKVNSEGDNSAQITTNDEDMRTEL